MPHASKIHASAIGWPVIGKARSAFALPLVWLARRRQRRELVRILHQPDYLLKDIGLQRHEIIQEAVKPFWEAVKPYWREDGEGGSFHRRAG